jgi:[citrate (pro-3S)-lyase] ligase
MQDRVIDPTQDVRLFAEEIAPVLNITVRFAGEEPLDNVTRQYNEAMRRILPEYRIGFEEIERKEADGALWGLVYRPGTRLTRAGGGSYWRR